jgi:hypothetical protein
LPTDVRGKPVEEPPDLTGVEAGARRLESTHQSLIAQLDPQRFSEDLLGVLVVAFAATRASLMTVNPQTGRLRIAAGVGLPPDIIGLDLKPGHRRISDWVMRERQPLILNGVVRDERFDGSATSGGIESAISIPLLGPHDVMGVVNLARTTNAPLFSEAELHDGERLGRAVAGILEEIEESERARRSWRRMSDEGAASVLGSETWATPRHQVAYARVLSPLAKADLVERLIHDDGTLALMLADVAGEGAPAHVLASFLRGLFLAFGRSTRSPEMMVRAINRELCQRPKERALAGLWISVLSPSGQLTSCNAGLPAPLSIPMDGGRVGLLESGGPMVGALADAAYRQTTVQLLPGDCVLAVTDGIVNAHNVAGEPFGWERVEALALEHRRHPLERLVSAVCDAARGHSGIVPVDDLTALAVRFSRED